MVANANDRFTDEDVTVFTQAVNAAQDFITENFDFNYNVDIVITAPSFLMSTIPEDGISGRTYNSRLIILVIDNQQIKITENFIFETICHEMSHSLRWEKLPEYSKTLFDGMIFEGLAITLEEKAMNSTNRKQKQFFLQEVQNTDQATIDSMIDQLCEDMKSEQYDYNTIFFTGNDTLPRWAGYRLGYYFVKQHLQKTNATISEVTLSSYSNFSLEI